MRFLKNCLKLIGIMYIFILSKNFFQLVFGYIFSSETDIKFYKIYNIQKSAYTIDLIFLLMLLYECFIFVYIYFFIFLILYFVVLNYGNRLWIHLIYFSSIYVLIIFSVSNIKTEFNIFCLLIMIILGILNWWMFEKWIKLK